MFLIKLKNIKEQIMTKKGIPPTPIEKELNAIKRLLIVLFMKIGMTQDELSLALQMDQASISRMIPTRKIKKGLIRNGNRSS